MQSYRLKRQEELITLPPLVAQVSHAAMRFRVQVTTFLDPRIVALGRRIMFLGPQFQTTLRISNRTRARLLQTRETPD